MNASLLSVKRASKVALAALCVLLVGAIVFYKERLFFADAAYIAFNIIDHKSMAIQEHRYGSFITQMVPYLGQKIHFPIRAILMGYAVSFNLFYLVVASLIVFRYKQYGLAILMALYYLLFVRDSYFWTNNEIHQAIAWMFLMFSVTIYLGHRKANIFILLTAFIPLAFLTLFTHFVVVIPTIFLWVFLWLEKRNWPFSKNTSLLLSSILMVMICLKFLLTSSNSYDQSHLHNVTHFSLKDIIDSFSSPFLNVFFYQCLVNYWVGLIVFLLSIVSLIINKNKLLAAWTILSCLGFLIILGLAYQDSREVYITPYLFHIESEWASISVIIAAPFVFILLPRLKPSIAVLSLAAIFSIRLIYIATAGPVFTWRTYFKEQVFSQMKKKGITKLGLINNRPLQEKYLLDWTLADETILMSAMAGEKPQLTFLFVDNNDQRLMKELSNPKKIAFVYQMADAANLNKEYFVFDTIHPYQIMSYEELLK